MLDGLRTPGPAAPEGACDSHIHIYDPRFAAARPEVAVVANATAADYRLLQGRIGTTRTVVVQPAAYGTDNPWFRRAKASGKLTEAEAAALRAELMETATVDEVRAIVERFVHAAPRALLDASATL